MNVDETRKAYEAAWSAYIRLDTKEATWGEIATALGIIGNSADDLIRALAAENAALRAALEPFAERYRDENMDLPMYKDEDIVYAWVYDEATVPAGEAIIQRKAFREAAAASAQE